MSACVCVCVCGGFLIISEWLRSMCLYVCRGWIGGQTDFGKDILIQIVVWVK